jgi:uncharacterized membrane protein YhaH (DUF805 family)
MDYMLLPLRRYADFRGRSQRKEYWLFVLFQWLLLLPLSAVFVALGGDAEKLLEEPFTFQGGTGDLVHILCLVVFAVMLVPFLAVQVRRLHDQDRTHWWILLGVVPFGQFPLLALMCFDGTPGANRYGPDPKRRDTVHRQDWRDAPADAARVAQRPKLGD